MVINFNSRQFLYFSSVFTKERRADDLIISFCCGFRFTRQSDDYVTAPYRVVTFPWNCTEDRLGRAELGGEIQFLVVTLWREKERKNVQISADNFKQRQDISKSCKINFRKGYTGLWPMNVNQIKVSAFNRLSRVYNECDWAFNLYKRRVHLLSFQGQSFAKRGTL